MAKWWDWSQRQSEKAVTDNLLKKQQPLRYIDPNDGEYYDVLTDKMVKVRPVTGTEIAMREQMKRVDLEHMEIAAQRRQRQIEAQIEMEQRQWGDPVPTPEQTMEHRHLVEQYKLSVERGEHAAQVYWLGEIAKLGQRKTEKIAPVPNIVKATIHKDAHFPTRWIAEAIDRAEASTKCITFTVEREGIVVMATEAGEKYAIKVSDWEAMETAEENPLLKAIDDCERKLDLLQKIKAKVA